MDLTALPGWVDQDAWDGFVELRLRQEKKSRGKIAWTARAEKLILAELYKLHAAGHDPNASLDQSTVRGWSDVWPATRKEIADLRPREVYPQEPPRTPEQRAADIAARDAVMAKIRLVS